VYPARELVERQKPQRPGAGRLKRRAARIRDRQEASVFAEILRRLCEGTGSRAAALVDGEGETVDYFAGVVDPFSVRVAAAEWRLVLNAAERARIPFWAATSVLLVRARSASYAIAPLSEGYAIVLQLARNCFRISERALAVATQELCDESGLKSAPLLGKGERWTRIRVQTVAGNPRKPLAIWHKNQWRGLVVLGRYRDLESGVREIGFRARLATGAEFGLVREPLGIWYAENLA
jgi:hypothetical protein